MDLNMNPEWLNAFVVFAQSSSLEAAAKELKTTQPTLTRQLKALEDSLGAGLFSMQGRRKVLTHIGQELLVELKPRFAGLNESVERALKHRNDPERTKITIGARREIIAAYVVKTKFPGRLLFEFLSHNEIVERLLTRRLDIGITHELPDSLNIQASPLFKDEFVVAYPKNWRLKHQSARQLLQTLSIEKPFLGYSTNAEWLKPILREFPPARVTRLCADWNIIATMISNGTGWSIAPQAQVSGQRNIEIQALPKDLSKPTQFYCIFLKELHSHSWFKDFVVALKESHLDQ